MDTGFSFEIPKASWTHHAKSSLKLVLLPKHKTYGRQEIRGISPGRQTPSVYIDTLISEKFRALIFFFHTHSLSLFFSFYFFDYQKWNPLIVFTYHMQSLHVFIYKSCFHWNEVNCWYLRLRTNREWYVLDWGGCWPSIKPMASICLRVKTQKALYSLRIYITDSYLHILIFIISLNNFRVAHSFMCHNIILLWYIAILYYVPQD